MESWSHCPLYDFQMNAQGMDRYPGPFISKPQEAGPDFNL
jgi:hypothetical protein